MNTPILGSLFIVATPLGNLQDMTLRAIDVLKTVDWIAAEDTRHSHYLLQHFSIATPCMSLHDFNERDRTEKIVELLRQGKSIALISDAGTPLISDPGFYLVRETRKHGIPIIPIPGACAAIAALCIAGLPTDRFVFEGFLPVKKALRTAHLTVLEQEERTMIFYEAPHRITETLLTLQEVFGDERQVVIARELTKMHETVYAGSLAAVIDMVRSDAHAEKGEMVVMIAGCQPGVMAEEKIAPRQIFKVLIGELPLSEAVKLTSKITGERKNVLYQLALEMRKDSS